MRSSMLALSHPLRKIQRRAKDMTSIIVQDSRVGHPANFEYCDNYCGGKQNCPK